MIITKDRIESKIDDIIESILAKDPKDITYSEYKILDCRSKDITYREEQKQRSEDMAKALASAFDCSAIATPHFLPEPDIKEDD